MQPYIHHDGNTKKLYVHGKQFLGLGGEICNSSSSNLDFMEEQVWPVIRDLGLNVVLAPVYWELIEPKEGQFNFELVKGLIKQARRENVKLVFLWFGLWKNAMSTYTPTWVKTDGEKYFRIRQPHGKPVNSISPFCTAAVEKDGIAFAKLMAFLKEFDGDDNTVIMIQVENELGALDTTRDFGEVAQSHYTQQIPSSIAGIYNVSGTWEEAFGDDAPEMFMATFYARAVESIAVRGLKEYSLPLFVNAWLDRQLPGRTGFYPSGGPIAKVMQIWQKEAPSIILCAPDIYNDKFEETCREYAVHGNPLLIPETHNSPISAFHAFPAICTFDAIAYCPFAIDHIHHNPETAPILSRTYKLLGGMSDLILANQGTGRMKGFVRLNEEFEFLTFDNYDIIITYSNRSVAPDNGGFHPVVTPSYADRYAGGFIIQTDSNSFVFAGMNYSAEIVQKKTDRSFVDFTYIQEGIFKNNEWIPGRWLNGDEYKIKFNSHTGVVKCGVYKFS